MTIPAFLQSSLQIPGASQPRTVCRLGLATRGENDLHERDVLHALERGVDFLNWCGAPDALSRTIAQLGARRAHVTICVQFEARTAHTAAEELARILRELNTSFVDILTLYYVEDSAEWQEISGPGGSLEFCKAAQRQGKVGLIGLTSHQRQLAAAIARSGALDLLMIRYNAAHRGAETEIFPTTDALGLPVVVYTCLRWGALLRGTVDDPPGFHVPEAPSWYRFTLQSRSVKVALMSPANRAELDKDLSVLEAGGPLTPAEYEVLAAHGARVRRYAGRFP
jgi:predicted aldo/keto reductase-like oxidoreductase